MTYEFLRPEAIYLLLLPIVATIARALIRRNRTGPTFSQGFPAGREKSTIKATLLALTPGVLTNLSILSLVLAMSEPVKTSVGIETKKYGADVVIALDKSKSMSATDVKPSRLESAKEFAKRLIQSRADDRFGLVAFSGAASILSPLGPEKSLTLARAASIEAEIEPTGTALGDGLALSLSLLEYSVAKNKFVVLISDGAGNAGTISTSLAVEAAGALGVKIYSVGTGDSTGAFIEFEGQRVFAAYSSEELRDAARRTGGEYFFASDSRGYERLLARVDSTEKTIVESKTYTRHEYFGDYFLIAAALLIALSQVYKFAIGPRDL